MLQQGYLGTAYLSLQLHIGMLQNLSGCLDLGKGYFLGLELGKCGEKEYIF